MAGPRPRKKKGPSKRRQPPQGRAAPRRGKRRPPARRQKRAAEARPSRRGKRGAPSRYAAKLLRQVKRVRMSAPAKGLMKSFVADLYGQVSGEAEQLRRRKRLPALGSSEVRQALRQVMPREVAKRAATPVGNLSA